MPPLVPKHLIDQILIIALVIVPVCSLTFIQIVNNRNEALARAEKQAQALTTLSQNPATTTSTAIRQENTRPIEIALPDAQQKARAFAESRKNLTAKHAIVMRTDGSTLFEREADVAVPLASITKVVTALTALKTIQKDHIVTITPEALATEGDSGLFPQEEWSRDALISLMLISSSNDGAEALARTNGNRQNFIDTMNELARTNGMPTMTFINPSGLDEGTASGGIGSARDVATLMQFGLTNAPRMMQHSATPEENIKSIDRVHTVRNTNIIAATVPGLLASKTGFTDNAGGNLVIAFDVGIGKRYIAVVLGSTWEDRFKDIALLVDNTLAYESQR